MKISIKNRCLNIKLVLITVSVLLSFASCTGDFFSTNTNKDTATEDELGYDNLALGSLIEQMQYQIYPSITKDQNIDVNNYQKMYCLAGDIYSGHQGASNMFDNNGRNNTTYSMTPDWYSIAYEMGYQNFMAPWYSIHLKRDVSPSTFAVGQILKVVGMHRITDMYGPIPYINFIPASDVPFTSQEMVYDTFFDELDESIEILKDYISMNPGSKPLREYDIIYGGDFNKWLLYANSLKLRLALRIVYVDEAKAKLKAEEAIADGVFTSNQDNAILPVTGTNTINPLYMICYSYNDTRLGATMESYLKGYDDPRLDLLFVKSDVSTGADYNGIRNGITFKVDEYIPFSTLNVTARTPIQFMTAAEVCFLRAEAALRGWNAGQDAQTLYEEGIRIAFDQPIGGNNAKAGDPTAYIQGTTLPKAYVDPVTSRYNTSNTGQVSVKWDPSVGQDRLLEKIITQKWIALYPDGQEAWSEYRRTGCPRVMPIYFNYSGGNINTAKQIARLPYPNNLKNDYPTLYPKAIELLNGADTGKTLLWWDKRANKPY